VVGLGERVQSRQRIGETEQADGAGKKEKRSRRDGGDRHDVECQAHSPSVDSEASATMRAVPFLTNAIEAKVASSARLKATSAAAGSSVTAPSSSNAAIPPVPINCAAIIRSASPGPRRIRTSPSDNINKMKPRAAVRNSVIPKCPRQCRLLHRQLCCDRL